VQWFKHDAVLIPLFRSMFQIIKFYKEGVLIDSCLNPFIQVYVSNKTLDSKELKRIENQVLIPLFRSMFQIMGKMGIGSCSIRVLIPLFRSMFQIIIIQ